MTISDDFTDANEFLRKSQQHELLRNTISNIEFDLKLKPYDQALIAQLDQLKKELAALDIEINTLAQGFAS